MIPEIARLKMLLTDPNPDVQAVTGKAGVILEALLDFLTLQYACAVPRKHGNAYALGDLLGAVNGKLLGALKVEVLDPTAAGQVAATVELQPILDAITQMAQARNVLGAHFNQASTFTRMTVSVLPGSLSNCPMPLSAPIMAGP